MSASDLGPGTAEALLENENTRTSTANVSDRRANPDSKYENDFVACQSRTVLYSAGRCGVRTTKLYRAQKDLGFTNIRLQAQDVVQLMYAVGEDGDGLGTRQAFMYGSGPRKPGAA